jgi:hypothetical protein
MKKDIYQELRAIGLTFDQCNEVLELMADLPVMRDAGLADVNVNVNISEGIIYLTKQQHGL